MMRVTVCVCVMCTSNSILTMSKVLPMQQAMTVGESYHLPQFLDGEGNL